MEDIQKIRDLIHTAGNTVFGATFIKKDGTERSMQCRLHVSEPKHEAWPEGIKDTRSEDEVNGVITVFDVNKQVEGEQGKGRYRRINLATLKSLRIRGVEHKF